MDKGVDKMKSIHDELDRMQEQTQKLGVNRLELCFAEEDLKYCSILKEKDCYQCKFYMTKKEFNQRRKKATARLRTLDKTTRLSIASKYKVKGIIRADER